ncbi:MAG: non-canonical purine NTP pyrophosphatase [Patescibacteria group bacterium]|jgi:8-oxo-dGTP diphosphatase
MKIFLATTNGGKIERLTKLLKQINVDIEVYTPADLHIEIPEIVETGKSLLENAKTKARAYFGKVQMPILANDTGFYVEGEGFIDAPKREALGEASEGTLSLEEISKKMADFWKGIAIKHGGKVDASWIESFVVLYQDGTMKEAESRRDVVLTNQEFGTPHVQMPVRALYYSKVTNKPAIQHTKEEEIQEMKPIIDALVNVLEY